MSLFVFYLLGDHRDIHVLALSFPTRRSSDLRLPRRPLRGRTAATSYTSPVKAYKGRTDQSAAVAAGQRSRNRVIDCWSGTRSRRYSRWVRAKIGSAHV